MRLICTLMLILCVAARLSGGFSFDINEMLSQNAQHSERYAENILADTERSLEKQLDEHLLQAGVSGETRIICAYDEYNYVRAEKVFILLGEQASAEELAVAERTAEELFPGAERQVTAGDRDSWTAAGTSE